MEILRENRGMVAGFSEGQAPLGIPTTTRDTLLRTLRELQDGLRLCIDVVERL
ncbi:hypothetical protein [Mesorhizobium sp. WSM2239]|uniref:Uncharacterized protein n=2 Tax=unclassified Mesorhizobium TaxID=325217 RepID=A0AAU8D1M2_9HYPH